MAPPRDKFFIPLDIESLQNVERSYLNVAIWPGTKDPKADVIQIRLSALKNEEWIELGTISLYRDEQGYRKLPPRQQVEQKQETIDDLSKKVQEHFDIFEEESKDTSLKEDS